MLLYLELAALCDRPCHLRSAAAPPTSQRHQGSYTPATAPSGALATRCSSTLFPPRLSHNPPDASLLLPLPSLTLHIRSLPDVVRAPPRSLPTRSGTLEPSPARPFSPHIPDVHQPGTAPGLRSGIAALLLSRCRDAE